MARLERVGSVEELQRLCRGRLLLVVYHAPDCPVCRLYLSALEASLDRVELPEGTIIVEANVYSMAREAVRVGVDAVPTIVVYRDCEPVGRGRGPLLPEELAELARQALAGANP